MTGRAACLAGLVVLALSRAASASDLGAEPPDLSSTLDRLVETYPETIAGHDGEALLLADGTRLPLSDGRVDKSFEEMLNRPDIGDMFAFAYPAGEEATAPSVDFDPGRIRVEPLFRALYGDCGKGDVAGRMRDVAWVRAHGGGKVRFTTAQGADRALEAVSKELDLLPRSFSKYLVPSAGTYNCRVIAGTQRMSMHAYGAAIDLNTAHSDYWLWTKPDAQGHYAWKNRIPAEIVAIFEKHGFVWGGRWYHYDTMHFEYRPELLPEKQ